MQELGITPEKLPGLDITSAIQRGIRDNGEVDVETGEVGEQANIDGSSADSRENQGDIPFYLLRTSEGDIEVYGFIDPKTGSIYLDSSIIKLEHPIHEYTHLWDRVVRKLNEDLWNRGVELMKSKALGLWNEVLNDESYGKNWVAKDIEGKKLDFLITSEVHSRCWQQVQLSSDNLIEVNLPSSVKDLFGECSFDSVTFKGAVLILPPSSIGRLRLSTVPSSASSSIIVETSCPQGKPFTTLVKYLFFRKAPDFSSVPLYSSSSGFPSSEFLSPDSLALS